jgi:hypothetical protein
MSISGKNLALVASAAASLLGATGAVHASTIGTAPATLTGVTTLGSGTSLTTVELGTGSGTGTLSSSDTFTISYKETGIIQPNFGTQTLTITATDTFTGTLSGNVFTPTSGEQTIISCTGGSDCPAAGVNTFKTVGGHFSTLAGGTGSIFGVDHPQGTTGTNTWAIGPFSPSAPPTIPLPAAVWLLGSGLVGLFSTARRRLDVVPG